MNDVKGTEDEWAREKAELTTSAENQKRELQAIIQEVSAYCTCLELFMSTMKDLPLRRVLMHYGSHLGHQRRESEGTDGYHRAPGHVRDDPQQEH